MFENEVNERRPEHFYYAQLTAEIASIPWRVWGKQPPPEVSDINNWLVNFKDPEDVKRKTEEESISAAAYKSELSRKAWMTFLGINEDGTLSGPLRTRKPPPIPGSSPAIVNSSPQSSQTPPGMGSTPPVPEIGPQNADKRQSRVFVRGVEQ